MKKQIKWILFAFVLGLVLAIGITVHGAMLLGSKGIIVTPKPTNIIEPMVSLPVTATAPKEQKIETPKASYSQAMTPEEARLRAIEARLTALEAKNK